MEQAYVLNDILLERNSISYSDTKSAIKKEIIGDLKKKKLVYSHSEVFADRGFLKDENVTVTVEGEDYEMTYGNFMTLLIMAKPFYKLNSPFPEELLFDPADLDGYSDYFTELMKHFKYSSGVKQVIMEIVGELATVSGEMNAIFGNSVSIKSLIDLSNNNKEFRDLLHYTLPDNQNIQFDEIEDIIKKNLNRIMEILGNTDNQLTSYINSGSGINSKQFGQVVSLIGSKPDLYGKIIPVPINTSFMRGLDVLAFYINALGARKALITNHQQVRNSGYLTRKLSVLMMDTNAIDSGEMNFDAPEIDLPEIKVSDIEDCGSHENNYMGISVSNKKILDRLNGRYYLNENGDLDVIDSMDEDFIGQTLKIPSPITCASNDGVCKKCYGELFNINKDLNIGMIAVLLLTDPLTQRLLSAKHLLETRSSKIEWGEDFERFLSVNRNLIYPKKYNNDVLIIKDEDYIEDEEREEYAFRKFSIKSGAKIISMTSPMSLTLSRSIQRNIESNYNNEENHYEIQINKTLNEGESLAHFIMENNELSQPLMKIKNLIETNAFIKEHNVEETINYFLFLLNEAGINIHSVHIELIVREMLKLEGERDRNKFREEKMPEYEMLRITDANLQGESLSKALLFEQVKRQLTTLETGTFEKRKSSILDKLL
jgi:RNA polymerase Rpb1, domain 5